MSTKFLNLRNLNTVRLNRSRVLAYLVTFENRHIAQFCTSKLKNAIPSAVYLERVKLGQLKQDPHQLKILEKFDLIQKAIEGFTPPVEEGSVVTSPKGLYIYGSAGAGKSMLMDIFHEAVQISGNRKRRVDFQSFISNAEVEIQKVKQGTDTASDAKVDDSISPVAQAIAEDTLLLSIDEFKAADIGDATILKRLFTELFQNGVVVVATSDSPLDDLQKDQLEHSVQMLKSHCDVVCLDSGIDYRQHLNTEAQTQDSKISSGDQYDENSISETFVRLRGLPYEATNEDITNFFSELEIVPNGIQTVVTRSGRSMGEAYVQFTSAKMAQEALQRNRNYIGPRYVEVFRINPAEIRKIDMIKERANPHFSPRPESSERLNSIGGGGGRFYSDASNNYASAETPFNRGSGVGGDSSGVNDENSERGANSTIGRHGILMRGLPFRSNEEDIRHFFHPLPLQGVTIIYNNRNLPSGSAKVYFASQDDLSIAMEKHMQQIGSRYIELFLDRGQDNRIGSQRQFNNSY